MSSLAEELPREINRVRRVLDTYKELRGTPNVLVEPQITMLEDLLDRATITASSGDVIQMLRVFEELKTWQG